MKPRRWTAFLMTTGRRRTTPASRPTLEDPDQISKAKRWCASTAASDVMRSTGWRHESRIGVELTTEGSKHVDELFFGNHTDIPETWNAWIYNKLNTPRTYQTEDVDR